jgi:hypothetical protein
VARVEMSGCSAPMLQRELEGLALLMGAASDRN